MKIIITGSAGFIGSAFAHAMARVPGAITIGIDNLSRRGAASNLAWLKRHAPNHLHEKADVRYPKELEAVFKRHRDADAVVHLAAQTAVTTSVVDPWSDFHANALGTFNMLEAVRRYTPRAAFLFSSTNKVFGDLEHEPIVKRGDRYEWPNKPDGIDESCPLDFHSPYGCSKGAADQYVRDYARIYGLRTVVFRQSCIYGPRQFGFEEQGWVAWFAIAAATGAPITIFGDGCQVRDLLWVDDLCSLYRAAIDNIGTVQGQVYNIGGGPRNALSVLDVVRILEKLHGKPLNPGNGPWRPGDQRVFVADTSRITRDIGWAPSVTAVDGVQRLATWVKESMPEIAEVACA